MSYLLDTNVLSESVRAKPNSRVMNWLTSVPTENLYVSVLTLGEIRKGIEKLDDKKRKEALISWLEQDVPDWFEERVLPIDQKVADRWGRLLHQAGRALPAIDTLIAATALQYDCRVVTRNLKDFNLPQLDLVNPWEFDLP